MASWVAVNCVSDDPFDSLHKLFVRGALVETPREGLTVITLKALHFFAMSHHLHSLHDLSLVVSDKLESEEEQVFEM